MSNINDLCAKCHLGRWRHTNPLLPGCHAFVEPTPQPDSAVVQTSPAAAAWVAGMQPEPSGDEAKVREITEHELWAWQKRLNDFTFSNCTHGGGDGHEPWLACWRCSEKFTRLERREAYAAGKADAMEQCKAADYLTESLRDPEMRKVFMEEWRRDNAWLEGGDENQADVLKVLDERIANMRGGPRLAEAREIRDAIARRGSEG